MLSPTENCPTYSGAGSKNSDRSWVNVQLARTNQGLAPKDLEPLIGSGGRVSEVPNHKRRPSLQMVKRLHDKLHILYESLLSAV